MQTLRIRQDHIGKGCPMHFEHDPLKITRASKQYVYDASGNQYLDCVNSVSQVGHCHPHVVRAGQEQMATLTACSGFLSDVQSGYVKRLVDTLPDRLSVCYFVNSGSEANDLALRLAYAYTHREDVLVIDNAYHGCLRNLIDISPLHYRKLGHHRKEHVHIVPCPDLYRGKYREEDGNACDKYVLEVRNTIEKCHSAGRQIGAFISEPLLTKCGIVTPPRDYLQQTYSYVRQAGGVCIADEVLTGLGRTGEYYWAFMHHDVVPDIVTCGKPLGNGHPMAIVVTTRDISDSLKDFTTTFGGNPVACAIGSAVLDVIQNEQLLGSTKSVGRVLLGAFQEIQKRHSILGDVRGSGLLLGLEMVTDKKSRTPSREAAELLIYKLKKRKILVAADGPDKNILIITPPLCFTCENAHQLTTTLDELLFEVEQDTNESPELSFTGLELVRAVDILPATGSDVQSLEQENHPEAKRARYEDVD